MADIKTRDAVKGTIKTIDKAAVASERMKSAYAKTKDKAEQGYYADESSATEYAADRVSCASERVTEEGVHQSINRVRKVFRPHRRISERQRTRLPISSKSGLPKPPSREWKGICQNNTACRSVTELQAVLLLPICPRVGKASS